MSLISVRTLLGSSSFMLLFLCSALANAYSSQRKRAPPNFNPPPRFRVDENNPDFLNRRLADSRLRQAWIDMWRLAAVACVTLDEEEEVYERYFEPGESEMVRCNSRI